MAEPCFTPVWAHCISGKAERDALLRLAVGADTPGALAGIGLRTAVFIHNALRGRLNGVFAGKRDRTPAAAPAGAAFAYEVRCDGRAHVGQHCCVCYDRQLFFY